MQLMNAEETKAFEAALAFLDECGDEVNDFTSRSSSYECTNTKRVHATLCHSTESELILSTQMMLASSPRLAQIYKRLLVLRLNCRFQVETDPEIPKGWSCLSCGWKP
ncbi:unnamed protein product [Phytophthora lilii]|uniref:Unnamed protein product n=1 Tax=Phytophthora lilii TaxID=2077276 RepID=A0A9W6TCG9_9STRA|nr:unnamed protein product [Phytophthora lilii]